MKKLLLLLFFLSSTLSIFSEDKSDQKLHFNNDGSFKIVQFTDLHFQQENTASQIVIRNIKNIINIEKPDMVVFTGDLVYSSPAEENLRTVLKYVSDKKIPFAVTLGNHDQQFDRSREDLYKIIQSIPYNIHSSTPDFVIPICSDKNPTTEALLYIIDSNTYSNIPDVKGYGWITYDQISWYRNESKKYTDASKTQKPLPAVAFFHIPLPEYFEAATSNDAILIGTRMEKACSPKINSGMFASFKEMGDVMATFVGHDHDNDYSVIWNGVLLSYGRYSGGNTEYNHLPTGARIIVLKEGERKFDTWIRQEDGQKVSLSHYPESYVKDDWKKRTNSK